MCLITVCPKGSNKNSEELKKAIKTAGVTNKDGAGFMYKRASTKKVYISKGYMSPEALLSAIEKHKLKDQDELVIHQRIGNKGAKNTFMCHPFVVAGDQDTILANHCYVNVPTMVHNGTFTKYSKTNSDFSDTYYFVEQFISNEFILGLLKSDLELFKTVFTDILSTNRLVFLFPNEDKPLIKLGSFTEDNGYFFSNESYKNSRYRNIGGWEEYDEWDWDNGYGYAASEYYNGGGRNWRERHIEDEEETKIPKKTASNCAVGKQIAMPLAGAMFPMTNYNHVSKRNDDIVIKETNSIAFSDIKTGIMYRRYMNMWIPDKYEGEHQFKSIRWEPLHINYMELTLQALETDITRDLEVNTYYRIISMSDTVCTLTKKYGTGTFNDFIYMERAQLALLFNIIPNTNQTRKYFDCYRLCRDIKASNNIIKQIVKLCNNPTAMKDPNNITFKRVRGLSRQGLFLYQLYAHQEVKGSVDINTLSSKTFKLLA